MNPEIILSMKVFFSSYPKGDATKEDILKFHLRQFNLFKFRYADQATLNGEPLNDIERREIMARLPGTVTGEVMVYGEPDEFLFIDRMTSLFEPLRIDLPGHLAVKADSYLRFMKERRDEVNGPESKLYEQKEYHSLRRVYSFILAEAYLRGMKLIKDMSKVEFKRYAEEKFKVQSGGPIYQTVRSTYKSESNFINYYTEMKREYFLDHEFAMRIFNKYYPDLG